MGLSPEEKKRIYEEEKARIEAREKIEREKLTAPAGTGTGLSPNIAGLLCYVGVWISGIIFLVLEQRNKFVRFHAAQSIVAFGTITVAGIILGLIPVVGVAFSWIIGIIGFIVWIIMIVKASSGEWYKLPWAGDVAEKIVASSRVTGEYSEPQPFRLGFCILLRQHCRLEQLQDNVRYHLQPQPGRIRPVFPAGIHSST